MSITIYELVRQLLTLKPALRDNDKKLIWSVWIHQGKVIGGKISIDDYLSSEIEESITRARRMVQNDFPELRPSPLIQEMRQKKEQEKGTFVYREQIDTSKPLTIPIEAKTGLLKYRKILEDKGILKPKNNA